MGSLAGWVETGLGEPYGAKPDPAAAYAALAARFERVPGVSLPEPVRGRFGRNALKVNGKIFAMLVKGALAVKLPTDEVASAAAAGEGKPLTTGRTRTMKEWLVVEELLSWHAYAMRAYAFTAGRRFASRLTSDRAGAKRS